MVKILDLLNEKNIVVLDSVSYSDAIETLLGLTKPSPNVSDYQSFCKAIKDREAIVSTGIGLGLAVPHARQDSIKDFVASAVLVRNGVEWRSIDDNPVNFAILIGSPWFLPHAPQRNRLLRLWRHTHRPGRHSLHLLSR